MQMGRMPLLDELATKERILVAGAGGGFDVFSGLPLFFHLRALGKEVHLANLSFSGVRSTPRRSLVHDVREVDAESESITDYFPEKHLSAWFRARGEDVPVWCFPRLGGRPLGEAYRALVEELGLDAIVLVDGGTDSLMRGDEESLGTPYEDVASLAAVDSLDGIDRFLVCVGFGVDAHHGVCHAHFLEGVAETIRADGYLGVHALLAPMEEVGLYREAVHATIASMPDHPSIVCTSVLAAIDGNYGDHHPTERTAGSELWINPLMSLMWCFRLDAVTRRCQYLEDVKATEYLTDIAEVIRDHRQRLGRVRPFFPIPV
ncbi:MAG: DUF1152 domain-containing protein [Planctomycetota bacterium]|jgi:hypothetical protein